jgi:hypothetical protein
MAIDRGGLEMVTNKSLKNKINENDQNTTSGMEPLAAH